MEITFSVHPSGAGSMTMTLSQERDWILQRENLALIRQCNKLIRDEFGVRLSLDQDDLLQNIIDFSLKSRSAQLRIICRPIALIHNQQTTIRQYRGQIVEAPTPSTRTDAEHIQANEAKKGKLMYRGQVVN
jgi:hypothetical protein